MLNGIQLGPRTRSQLKLYGPNLSGSGLRSRVSSLATDGGFTLLELILVLVLIGIVAALAANLLANSLDQGRFEETQKRMEELKWGIAGNPDLVSNGVRTHFGYLGDVGEFPSSLDDLVTKPGSVAAWNASTEMGWNGPYVKSNFQENPNAFKTDGWGNTLSYNNTTAVITSLGSDNAAGGSGYAADLNTEDLSSKKTGTVRVVAAYTSGSPATGTVLTIYYPDGTGNQTSSSRTLVAGDNGAWNFTSIPIGRRRVTATLSGTTTTKYAVLLGSTVSVDFVIPTGSPATPTNFHAANGSPGNPSTVELSWTANTEADLKGYNIYRCTGNRCGTESYYTTVGLVTSYSDTGVVNNRTYCYQLQAINYAGQGSAWTTEDCATAR